jgi:hypothetical protein
MKRKLQNESEQKLNLEKTDEGYVVRVSGLPARGLRCWERIFSIQNKQDRKIMTCRSRSLEKL